MQKVCYDIAMSTSGMLFNIQKYCTDDGPGIRTTLFFKGCPLRCGWCSNPESQVGKRQVMWDEKKCTFCRLCVKNCKADAISCTGGVIKTNPNKCEGYTTCVDVCAAGARVIAGKRYHVNAVLSTCLQDQSFYEESGGGVTLSGGEPFMQAEFALELLKLLTQNGIHTAVETCGFVSSQVFQPILPYISLLLYDIKHHELKKHVQGTGVSNEMILRNLRLALHEGKDVLVRIPVIPGYNNSLDDADAFCKLLSPMGVTRVQLLPFHHYGEYKYKQLGYAYAYHTVPSLYPDDLQSYQRVFTAQKIDCFTA